MENSGGKREQLGLENREAHEISASEISLQEQDLIGRGGFGKLN